MSADPGGLRESFIAENPDADPDQLVQMNVRLPRWLVWALDRRRDKIDMSRDKWVRNALRFTLNQPGSPRRGGRTVARTSRGRTIQPGGNTR